MGNSVPKFKEAKLKTFLEAAIQRISIVKTKKINQNANLKEELANYLRNSKEELASIKVEGYMQTENTIAVLEILSVMCAQCSERIRQISESKECPEEIRPMIETIIYSADKLEIPELLEIRAQFAGKWGMEFCERAVNNYERIVNSIVVDKLAGNIPNYQLKNEKLNEIAAEKNIQFMQRQVSIDDLVRNTPDPATLRAIEEHKDEERKEETDSREEEKRNRIDDIAALEERFRHLK